MANVAWLGLGVMGYPMAGHLKVRGGNDLRVYNRSPAKAEKWCAEFGGRVAASTAEAARDCDAVFACVGNDDDVRSITVGPDGAFSRMRPGALFIDHTTASANVARELAAAAGQHGLEFLDCPVSGGQAGAEAGSLTVMAGGDEAAFARAEPLIKSYAGSIRRMGPAGSGQLGENGQSDCIAGVIQGLAEAIHFGECAGLDIEALSRRSQRAPRSRGRWRTAGGPCTTASSTSASPLIGCARTWRSVSMRRLRTVPTSRSRG